jgi:hexosaminidase
LNGGYHYRIPPPGGVIEEGKLNANIAYPGLIIRYTTDGTEPTTESLLYENPTPVSGTVLLKSFDSAGKSSRTVQIIEN